MVYLSCRVREYTHLVEMILYLTSGVEVFCLNVVLHVSNRIVPVR